MRRSGAFWYIGSKNVGSTLLGLTLSLLSLPAFGQSEITLTRISQPITLDGLPFEPAWEEVPPFEARQYEPNNGALPTEETEFLVAYDDQYLYLALRAFDRDPSGIRVNTLYRDGLAGSDHFEILIDAFNDNETGIVFATHPAGGRRDVAVSNDASGGGIASGGWINSSYNTFWDVATKVTDEGWFAEMRIPFSSLRFQVQDGRIVMGMSFQRMIARKGERLVFPYVERFTDWAFLKPSLAQDFVLEGLTPSQPVYLTPYGLGRLEQRPPADAPRDDELNGDIGADLKYAPTRNWNVDLTFNTDFAQVEADDQQVNLTRFSLFFPEKRQFFQERAAIFDFRTGGLSRLFHSRRIGLTSDGEPIRIWGGARVVGRVNDWDLGLLDMQSAAEKGQASENFSVLRLRRQVFNRYSYAGAMTTTRIGNDGSYNLAYGLDAVIRVAGDDYLTVQWAQTADHEQFAADAYKPFTSARFTAEMERRRREGWGYTSVLAWAGADYLPGLGFTQRNDFTYLGDGLSYTWMQGEDSRILYYTLGADGLAFLRNADGTLESLELGPQWAFGTKAGADGVFELKWRIEDLLEPYALSESALVPAGRYGFWEVRASYGEPYTSLATISPAVEAGSFYDGWRLTLRARPRWRASRYFTLTTNYEYNHVRFPDRDQVFDAHLAGLRIDTALNTRFSTNAFFQYSNTTNAVLANVRMRYNFREGNDLWIVYNHRVNTDRGIDPARLPFTDTRTVLVKYTYTFIL